MRKLVTVIVLLVLVGAMYSAYYILSRPKAPRNPFSVTGTISTEQAVDIATGDSMVTLRNASPFYAGAHAPAGQQTQVVDDLRAKKVAELLATAQTLAKDVDGMSASIDALEKGYLDYLDTARTKQTDLAPMVRQTVRQVVLDHCKAAASGACYRAMAVQSTEPHSTATVQYQKVLLAMRYGTATLRRLDDISSFAAIAYRHGEKSADPAVKQALQTLDTTMDGMNALGKPAKAVDDGINHILFGLRQIETSDYYYARASVNFMRATLPEVQAKLQTLQPRGDFTADQVKMAKDFAGDLQAAVDHLGRKLDTQDTKRLIALTEPTHPMACAYAGAADQRAFQQAALSYQTKEQREAAKGGGSLGDFAAVTWKAMKMAPGAAVEMTTFEMKNVMRRGLGVWYGNTKEEVDKDVSEYEKEVDKHFQENTMGTEPLRTAKEGMQYIENTCQQKAESFMSESGVPLADSPLAAKLTGLVAKGTVSVLTGFAKGVYALTDPSSSNGELAEGSLEIACSMLGGSRMLPTPKLLANGAEKFLGWTGSKIGGALVNMAEKSFGARTLYEEVIRNGSPLLVNLMERHIGYATMNILKATRASLKEEFAQMVKAGLLAAGENAKEVAAKSLFEFAKKEFTTSMSGLAQALGTMYGTDMAEFMAVMTGQTLDDMLKDLVRETLDSPDGTYSGNITGKAGGSMTLVLKNGAVSGHISGSYQGDGFSCAISGSAEGGAIKCHLSGSLEDAQSHHSYAFHGTLSGHVKNGQAGGSWSASNQWGANDGSWSAAK